MAIMGTGGNTPPTLLTTNTGGNTPALPTASPVPIMDWRTKLAQGNTSAQTRQVGSNELVENRLNGLTDGDSRYLQIARDNATTAASGRGMLMSSMAGGNAERAAIEAGMPIAQADAASFGRVADANMAAINADRLADQQMYGNLTGQEVGIRANLDEAERGRGFTARENLLGRQFQTGERLGAEAYQNTQNNLQRQHEVRLQETQRVFEASMKALDRDFTGSQNDKQLVQQRFLEFNKSMEQHNINLSNTLSAIYSNTALTAEQQAAAAANARAVHQSLFNSYAATMAGGVPQIFWNPYPMSSAPTSPTPPPPTPPPPPGGGAATPPPPTGAGQTTLTNGQPMTLQQAQQTYGGTWVERNGVLYRIAR